jgi:hypothetical protein
MENKRKRKTDLNESTKRVKKYPKHKCNNNNIKDIGTDNINNNNNNIAIIFISGEVIMSYIIPDKIISDIERDFIKLSSNKNYEIANNQKYNKDIYVAFNYIIWATNFLDQAWTDKLKSYFNKSTYESLKDGKYNYKYSYAKKLFSDNSSKWEEYSNLEEGYIENNISLISFIDVNDCDEYLD